MGAEVIYKGGGIVLDTEILARTAGEREHHSSPSFGSQNDFGWYDNGVRHWFSLTNDTVIFYSAWSNCFWELHRDENYNRPHAVMAGKLPALKRAMWADAFGVVTNSFLTHRILGVKSQVRFDLEKAFLLLFNSCEPHDLEGIESLIARSRYELSFSKTDSIQWENAIRRYGDALRELAQQRLRRKAPRTVHELRGLPSSFGNLVGELTIPAKWRRRGPVRLEQSVFRLHEKIVSVSLVIEREDLLREWKKRRTLKYCFAEMEPGAYTVASEWFEGTTSVSHETQEGRVVGE